MDRVTNLSQAVFGLVQCRRTNRSSSRWKRRLRLTLAISLLSFSAACIAENQKPVNLLNWRVLGVGTAESEESDSAVRLTEGAYSKGVVLLSPSTYGQRVVVTFEVKPLVHELICVLFLSASSIAGPEIDPGEDYDGNFDYWRGTQAQVSSYTFAFHTGFHQPYAFVIRNPGPVELDKRRDLAVEQRWYQVEFGREGKEVWLNVDGQELLRGVDPTEGALPGGHIGFRIRGPGNGSAAALYRNVYIRDLD